MKTCLRSLRISSVSLVFGVQLFLLLISPIHLSGAPYGAFSVNCNVSSDGSVLFQAKNGNKMQPGVLIYIDNECHGQTDGNGINMAGPFIAGEHTWHAMLDNRTIGAGAFNTPPVTGLVFQDRGCVLGGEMRPSGLKVRPFLDEWTGYFSVQNTGTTPVNHFAVSFICPMRKEKSMTVKLVSPPIPGWLWKPFMGKMMDMNRRRMLVSIEDRQVTMKDAFSHLPITVLEAKTTKPLGENGLLPGTQLTVIYKEPYKDCIAGFVQSIGDQMEFEVEQEIIDPENNILRVIFKAFQFGPMTFDEVKANIIFKGRGEEGTCTLGLYIDDEMVDQTPWIDYEWY